jgi:hypothetical protein
MFAKKLPLAACPRFETAIRAGPEKTLIADFIENLQKRQLSS